MKIWSTTFGCKVNQYETELLRHRMTGPGDTHVATPAEADVCLINSCSVTSFADKECRQMIRRVLRENPSARTIVTGCYATRAPEELRAISKRVEIYSNEEKEQLPTCVGFEVADRPLGIHQFAGRTRAFLKIQDGCRAPCNYCIIPTVRPTMSSKPVEQVLKEARALLENGYQELVLTGIRLGLYHGVSADGSEKINLLGLLRELTALPHRFRVRLSSLEVTEVSDALIGFVAGNTKICRHFHIPLQSGSTSVLRAMKRWYDADKYAERISAIRGGIPDVGITADVMVGYPTESDSHFEETFKFIEDQELSGLHVFRFSAREGTDAARLTPLDPRTVAERAARLGSLDRRLRERFYWKHAGSVREVLPEPNGEGWTDNYLRVHLPPGSSDAGLGPQKVWSPVFEPASGAVRAVAS